MRKLKSWANFIGLIGCLVTADRAFAQVTWQQPEIRLVEKSVLDGAVTVLIPENFTRMTEELLRLKYPSDRRPALVFTNERGSVNLGMSLTGNAVRPEQIPDLHKVIETTFRNLYPSATWYRSEIITQNGRRYFTLDLLTPAVDTQVRNVMLGTSFRGRLLMFTFNVSRELEKDWLDTGRGMLSSIKVAE